MDQGLQKIIEYEKLLFQARYTDWINNDLFSLKWWVSIGLLTIPWILWRVLICKTKLVETLIYGAIMSGIILLIDEAGSDLSLWSYTVRIAPVFPRFLPFSYSLVPVVYMLLYQYFPKWKDFIFVNIIASTVFSLILLPLAEKWGFILFLNWKHIYTTLIFITTGLFSKLLIEIVNKIENRSAA